MEQKNFATKLWTVVDCTRRGRFKRIIFGFIQTRIPADDVAFNGGMVRIGVAIHGNYIAHRGNGRKHLLDNGMTNKHFKMNYSRLFNIANNAHSEHVTKPSVRSSFELWLLESSLSNAHHNVDVVMLRFARFRFMLAYSRVLPLSSRYSPWRSMEFRRIFSTTFWLPAYA